MTAKRSLPILEIVIATVALAAFLTYGYVTAQRSRESAQKFDTRSSYDAASGGYRAWYEMLDNEGVRVQRFERRPAFLHQSVDVYIFASNVSQRFARAASSESVDQVTDGDWAALAKWVRAGGHAVWLADGFEETNYMNVPTISLRGPTHDSAVAIAPSPLDAGVNGVDGTARLRVPYGKSGVASPIVADDTGAVVVSYPLGKGIVTVVTDESLFENARLAKADNARLAFDLATTGLTPHGAVAFDEWSHGFDAGDTWWAVLPRPFQRALIAMGCAALLLLVGTALRFGPTARLPDESERTSSEYLTSMAMLYERGRAYRAAIGELADACVRDVAGSLGLPETASARAVAMRVGGDSDAYPEMILDLDRLRSYEYPHAADLMRAAHLCAVLRKEFVRHGRIGIGRRASTARRTA